MSNGATYLAAHVNVISADDLERRAEGAEAWVAAAKKPKLTGVGWAGVAMLLGAGAWWAVGRRRKS